MPQKKICGQNSNHYMKFENHYNTTRCALSAELFGPGHFVGLGLGLGLKKS
jgi:hypothetical protein